jgi:trigger factor
MQISVKNLPKSEIEITVEVDAETLENAKKEALNRFQKEVKVEGFREGKIPEEKIIEKVGEKNITLEANDIAIKLAYTEAVKSKELKVVSYPKVEVISAEPLKFTAKVAVLPTVEVGDWKKIKLTKEELKIEKKEIEAVVKDILKGNAEAKEIKDGEAKKGHRVEVDFAGSTPDGVPLDNTQSKNHPLTLGEGSFIPGFEEGIEGMKVGDEKEHTVKFPKDYHAKQLADKDVKFKIKLNKIEELTEPKLDDEFAKKVSGGQKEKWGDIEKDIEEHLKSRKETQANQKLEADLVKELLKIGKVEIPETLIDEEVEFMMKDLQQRLSGGGMDWEKYLEATKKSEEQIRKEMREEGEKRVKVRLILDKLVETEKIEVPEAEVEAAVEQEAARHPESEKSKVKENFAAGNVNRLRLQHQLKVIKLLGDLIKALSK